MAEASAAEALDNWAQQLEEVTVLQSICGEDFSVLAEGFGGSSGGGRGKDAAEATESATYSEELASRLPAELLECQAAVHAELPSEGLALSVSQHLDVATCRHRMCFHLIKRLHKQQET